MTMVTTIWNRLTIKSTLDDTGFSYIWNIQIKCLWRIILTIEIKNLYFNRIFLLARLLKCLPHISSHCNSTPKWISIYKRYIPNRPSLSMSRYMWRYEVDRGVLYFKMRSILVTKLENYLIHEKCVYQISYFPDFGPYGGTFGDYFACK